MKKKIIIFISIVLAIPLLIGTMYIIDKNRMKNNKQVIFSTWGYSYVPPINLNENALNTAISNFVINENESKSLKYENEKYFVAFKNYLINEIDETNIIVYSWVLNESYYKKDGVAINNNGVSIPYKFILSKNNDNYEVVDYQVPRDGYYAEDMKAIFPSEVLKRLNEVNLDGTIDELKLSIERQVSKYFNTETLTTSYNSFIGTVLEETTTYMIVEPNEDEYERKSADKIRINYGTDHIDYLYGIGRKVLVSYIGHIMETYPAQINTDNVSVGGYSDFEISIKKSDEVVANKILNNIDLYKNNSNYNLYYYGLGEVNVKVDNQIISLEEALKSGKITLEKIISNANNDLDNGKITGDMYKDGGSTVYYYDDYTIIKCNMLNGNRDVWIGICEMTINDVK